MLCARVLRQDTDDQFLNKHSLADTSATKETNLSTTSVRGQKIDDLDASDKHFGACGLFDEGWGIGVNGSQFCCFDRTPLVNGITSDVHDTTQCAGADWDSDGRSSVGCCATTDETLGTWSKSAVTLIK